MQTTTATVRPFSNDKLEDQLKGKMGALIRSNLSKEQEAKLNEAFGEE